MEEKETRKIRQEILQKHLHTGSMFSTDVNGRILRAMQEYRNYSNSSNSSNPEPETVTIEEMFEFVRWKEDHRLIYGADMSWYKLMITDGDTLSTEYFVKSDQDLWKKYLEEKNKVKQ